MRDMSYFKPDIVWDEYLENSLKATIRGKHGSGVRQHVPANNLPRNWREFLRAEHAGIARASR